MQKLIKDGVIVDDKWRLEGQLSSRRDGGLPGEDHVIVSLESWLFQRELFSPSEEQVGVYTEAGEIPKALLDNIHRFPLIAIKFSSFVDGRGFSMGTLLRERYGYAGELRAIGNIIPDQLFYLKRCGFNAFSMAEGVDLTVACSALKDFSESYQEGYDQPVPLFSRRS